MSTKRRSKLEMVNDMLKAIQNKGGKIKPTHLLYKSNLSHSKMKEYLDELMSKGLVEEIMQNDKRMFSITEKGYNFLTEFEKIRDFSESFGL